MIAGKNKSIDIYPCLQYYRIYREVLVSHHIYIYADLERNLYMVLLVVSLIYLYQQRSCLSQQMFTDTSQEQV